MPCRRWATTFPGEQERIDIQFLPNLEGYIWVFPRCGHLSVGICGKGEPASALRKRLEHYMAEKGISLEGRAVLQPPAAFARDASRGKRTACRAKGGWRWAMRPAWWTPSPARACITPSDPGDLAAQALLARFGGAGHCITASCCARFCGATWSSARGWRSGCFTGRFLFGSVPARMVQFTRRSPRFSAIMQDLFAGTQPYLGFEAAAAAKI